MPGSVRHGQLGVGDAVSAFGWRCGGGPMFQSQAAEENALILLDLLFWPDVLAVVIWRSGAWDLIPQIVSLFSS